HDCCDGEADRAEMYRNPLARRWTCERLLSHVRFVRCRRCLSRGEDGERQLGGGHNLWRDCRRWRLEAGWNETPQSCVIQQQETQGENEIVQEGVIRGENHHDLPRGDDEEAKQ